MSRPFPFIVIGRDEMAIFTDCRLGDHHFLNKEIRYEGEDEQDTQKYNGNFHRWRPFPVIDYNT
jgi:hypothetical protein